MPTWVQQTTGIVCRMIFPGAIVTLEYDRAWQRLTVSFDSLRKVVYYGVPADVAARLVDTRSPDEAFAQHVFGSYAWTEIGALPMDLERSG